MSLINRFEKKWFYKSVDKTSFLISLHRSKFIFKEQYLPRNVNTIYFDDKNYSSILENLDGTFIKKKYRLRWYGNSLVINNPQFEIKSKKGLIVSKEVIPFKIKKKIKLNYKNLQILTDLFLTKLKNKPFLKPILTTNYFRYYFISSNKDIRATFDTNIASYQISRYYNLDFKKNFTHSVLEMKYPQKYDSYVSSQFNSISARSSKSSKYVFSALEKAKGFS